MTFVSKVYLVNDRLSLADIIMYYGLHRYMVGGGW